MAHWPYNTSAWQKLRKAKLVSMPLCQPCLARGHQTPANTVDHIKPINDGGAPFPSLDRLMSMCQRCHNEKTAAADRTDKKPFARRIKGFDAQGNPVDPSDDWHLGGGLNHQNDPALGPASSHRRYLVSPSQAIDETDDLGFA